MNYDIPSTPISGAGPNSPLNDNCAPVIGQHGSAQLAVTAWTEAGMPQDRIVLGVPMYGRSYHVQKSVAFSSKSNTTLAPYPPYGQGNKPKGDRWNGDGELDVCGVFQPPGGSYAFWSLVESDFLNADGTPKRGILYRYDECSNTPYIYNTTSEIMIAYDDARSFAAKGDFIKVNGLKGFAAWESAGDFRNLLLDAIINGTVNGITQATHGSPQPSAKAPTKSSTASHLLFAPTMCWALILGVYCLLSWTAV